MTPKERQKFLRQVQVLIAPEITFRRRKPSPGQREFAFMAGEDPRRSGWDLVTSRPLTPEQAGRADAQAQAEAGNKGKGKGKPR